MNLICSISKLLISVSLIIYYCLHALGAAYASSSANVPASSFLPTHVSYGFSSQALHGDSDLAVPVSQSLATGRGCPVGDVAADTSPVLMPSPELLNRHPGSPYPLHLQASSTPMVMQVSYFCLYLL